MRIPRRYFRFGIRGWSILCVLIAVTLSVLNNRAARQRECVAHILQLGGTVAYDESSWLATTFAPRISSVSLNAFKQMPNLTQLGVSDTQLGFDDEDALQKALPNCEVIGSPRGMGMPVTISDWSRPSDD